MMQIESDDGDGARLITNIIEQSLHCIGINTVESQIKASQENMTSSSIHQIITAPNDLWTGNYEHLESKSDVALLKWSFNYAQNQDQLNEIMKSVKGKLKPNQVAIGGTLTCFDQDIIPKSSNPMEFSLNLHEDCYKNYDPTYQIHYALYYHLFFNNDPGNIDD